MSGMTPRSFTGTVTIDNDSAKSGKYYGSFVFSENGQMKALLPVHITVKPTVTVAENVIRSIWLR